MLSGGNALLDGRGGVEAPLPTAPLSVTSRHCLVALGKWQRLDKEPPNDKAFLPASLHQSWAIQGQPAPKGLITLTQGLALRTVSLPCGGWGKGYDITLAQV